MVIPEISFYPNIKPVLKWAGGKRSLIPDIRKFYKHLKPKRYIEPFFGGGAVYFDVLKTFGIEYKGKSIINDINTDLIEMYRNIKIDPAEVIYQYRLLEKEYYKNGYYFIRSRFNGLDRNKQKVQKYSGIARSAALILLNRTCFNGLYRVNKNGIFNAPKGSYKNPTIIDESNLYAISELLPDINNIKNTNFDTIDIIGKGDLVYLDPPYHPISSTSSFVSYSDTSFKKPEQLKLKNYFDKLNEKGAYVILSNSYSRFISEMYHKYDIITVNCRRNINSKADKRNKIAEYLVIGNKIHHR